MMFAVTAAVVGACVALAAFAASFPVARAQNERTVQYLVHAYKPGTSAAAARSYLISHHYHELRPCPGCLQMWLPCRGGLCVHRYALYAGGLSRHCSSWAIIAIASRGHISDLWGSSIAYWAYGYPNEPIRFECPQLRWLAPAPDSELSGKQTELWYCRSDPYIRRWQKLYMNLHGFVVDWKTTFKPHPYPC